MLGINKISLSTILFFEIFVFSIEKSDFYDYDSAKNIFCSDVTVGCVFTISYSYPFSPKIPTEIPVKAILGDYRYIYLIFHIPKNMQKKFYLMAYDTSDKKTIISNGNYYKIDCDINTDYEIRIYKELNNDTFVEFLFLGLKKNFEMKVEIRFKLDINLYFYDFKLDKDNSLNSNSNKEISNYYNELKKKVKKRLAIVEEAIYNTNQILRKKFDITMSFSKEELKFSKTAFVPPCFVVTATIATELDTSISRFMNETEDGFQVINGMIIEEKNKINYQVDGSDLIKSLKGEDINVIKTFQSYFGDIENLFLESSLQYEQICLTVSTNLQCVKYTLSFTEDHKYFEQIYYIELKIEVTNPIIYKPAPVYAYGINWNTVNLKLKPILGGVVFVLTVSAAIAGIVNGVDTSALNIPDFPL